MTSHVQLFRLQMALCSALRRPAVGCLHKPASFCPQQVGPSHLESGPQAAVGAAPHASRPDGPADEGP